MDNGVIAGSDRGKSRVIKLSDFFSLYQFFQLGLCESRSQSLLATTCIHRYVQSRTTKFCAVRTMAGSVTTAVVESSSELDPVLNLAARITQHAHLLIPGRTDQQLVTDTRQGVKLAFDRGELTGHSSTLSLVFLGRNFETLRADCIDTYSSSL